ncbi:zinc finger protein 271-like [Orussus abietinus]|nr:zinc finger protein 271-like [Orussus abietinus]
MKADALLRAELNESKKLSTVETVDNDTGSTRLIKSQIQETLREALNMRIKKIKKTDINGPVECELCNKMFRDMNLFDSHIETIHLLKWRCNLCDKSYETSKELISHKENIHGGNIIFCKACVEAESASENQTDQIKEEVFKRPISPNTNDDFDIPIVTDAAPLALCSLEVLCDICDASVDDDDLLRAHKKVHLPKLKTCNMCQVECSSIYALFEHKKDIHNLYKRVNLKFVCDLCGKYFSNSWQWENHEENVCPKKFSKYTCKYCKICFSTNHKLTRHLRKHKMEMLDDPSVTIYKCIACPKVFVDKEFYQKHRNVHDPECWDKYKCKLCNRSFRDNVRLKEHHQSIHEGIKPHQCDICGRTFHRLSNMRVHRAKHFGHKCDHCEEVFERLRQLANHVQQVHGLEPNIRIQPKKQYTSGCFVCRYCGKKLATYKSVLDHEHIHTGEKPYSCHICEKKFRSYTARWSHIQRHDKGNFVCEHCGKCFSYKQNLTTHMQIHVPMENRKHQCSKCGKRFLRKSHLNVHMRIHDGVRPYTCDICLFSFTQLGDMRRHRARHANGDVRIRQPRVKSIPTSSNEDTN